MTVMITGVQYLEDSLRPVRPSASELLKAEQEQPCRGNVKTDYVTELRNNSGFASTNIYRHTPPPCHMQTIHILGISAP